MTIAPERYRFYGSIDIQTTTFNVELIDVVVEGSEATRARRDGQEMFDRTSAKNQRKLLKFPPLSSRRPSVTTRWQTTLKN